MDTIQIFIGAPNVNRCLPYDMDRTSPGGEAGWKACRFFCENKYSSQKKKNEVQRGRFPIGTTQTRHELTSELLSCIAGHQRRTSVFYSQWVSDAGKKVDSTAFPFDDISELTSVTKHCHVSLHDQKPPNGRDCLQTLNSVLWDPLECFSTVLGNPEYEHTAYQGTADEYTTCSLIQTSDDSSLISFLEDKKDHQLNGSCPDKGSAICFTNLTYQLNNIGVSSCKRKKVTASFDLPSKNSQKSKKPKQSRSLLKYVRKVCDTSCTLLKNCSEKNLEYSILAVVVQPCHLKEIQVKSGPKLGSAFPLSTIVVLDQSEVSCKVLLWRAAASWSLSLRLGDIIRVTNLAMYEDKWNGETLLQSTTKSCLENLGNCSSICIHEYSDFVEYLVLNELMSYIYKKHYYLTDLQAWQPQKRDCVQHVRLSQLQPELLVHSFLKVNAISPLNECIYGYKGLKQNKIMLTVEDVKGQSRILILCGTSVSWCNQICLKRDHIWEFRYLLCKKNLISGDVELHTTPWSSCECLFDDDKRAVNFQKQYFENVSSPMFLSLQTLLKERYSGVIQIKGSISELEFPLPGKQSILMTQKSSIINILLCLSSVQYSGCEKCKRELKIDENHVYQQCFACLPFKQVQMFYRPAIMTVVHEKNLIWIYVPSDVVQKLFLNICPKLLNRRVTCSTDITYGAIVADLCHSLLVETRESYLFTIESHFSLDNNSVPLVQEFHILDLHVDI